MCHWLSVERGMSCPTALMLVDKQHKSHHIYCLFRGPLTSQRAAAEMQAEMLKRFDRAKCEHTVQKICLMSCSPL